MTITTQRVKYLIKDLSPEEYAKWSYNSSTRLAALSLISHIRSNEPIDSQKCNFDSDSALISSPDFTTKKHEEKFIIDKHIMSFMNVAQIYGPFRAGLIAAGAVVLKNARFRALGISLYQNENKTVPSIEEKVKSLSSEHIKTIHQFTERVNEFISSILSAH